jgi:hypothetical protein
MMGAPAVRAGPSGRIADLEIRPNCKAHSKVIAKAGAYNLSAYSRRVAELVDAAIVMTKATATAMVRRRGKVLTERLAALPER